VRARFESCCRRRRRKKKKALSDLREKKGKILAAMPTFSPARREGGGKAEGPPKWARMHNQKKKGGRAIQSLASVNLPQGKARGGEKKGQKNSALLSARARGKKKGDRSLATFLLVFL